MISSGLKGLNRHWVNLFCLLGRDSCGIFYESNHQQSPLCCDLNALLSRTLRFSYEINQKLGRYYPRSFSRSV